MRVSLSTTAQPNNRKLARSAWRRLWRISLTFSASIAALLSAPARADEVEISGTNTEPYSTSTVDGGVAGDIFLSSGARIELENGTAITIDSDNYVNVEGVIEIDSSDGSIGVQIDPGVTTTFTNEGTISLLAPELDDDEDLTLTTDLDDDRFALLVATGGTATGDITNSGSIIVYGDASASVRIDGDLDGNVLNEGVITTIGSGSAGIWTIGAVNGDITNDGSVSSSGIDAYGIRISGEVTGTVINAGSVATNGYDDTTPDDEDDEDNDNAEQALQQTGSAVWIGNSVSEGFLNNGPDQAELDAIADETFTGDQTPYSSMSILGEAPTLLVTPDVDADITLGAVGTDDDDLYGIINRGTISANGVYEGVSATAVQIIGTDTYTVTVEGGLRNEFTISASALDADVTGIHIGDNAVVPTIYNTSSISAANLSEDTNYTATAILIDGTASVDTIVNEGSISATFNGLLGDAYTIVDTASTVSLVENSGTISAALVEIDDDDEDTDDEPQGETVAIDFSTSSQDVTILNFLPDDFDSDENEVTEFGVIIGDVRLGSGNDTLSFASGGILGDIAFGAGDDTFTMSDGIAIGDIAFGDGQDAIILSGDAEFTGAISDSDGTLDITTSGNAILSIDEVGTVNIETATIGGNSTLDLAVDAEIGTSALLDASGTISFIDNGTISPTFVTPFTEDFSITILAADTIDYDGATNDLLGEDLPFIFNIDLQESTTGTGEELVMTFTQKTTEELGIAPNLATIYDPLLESITLDEDLGVAFLNISTATEFESAFNQFLPTTTDASFAISQYGAMTMAQSLRDRVDYVVGGKRRGGGWVSETSIGLDADQLVGRRGYDASSVNVSFGLDDYLWGGTLLGLVVSVENGSIEEDGDFDEPLTISRWIFSAYGARQVGPAILTASGFWGRNAYESQRNIVIDEVQRSAFGEWNGSQYGADISLTSLQQWGHLRIQPTIGTNYFALSEDGYAEAGGVDPDSENNAVALVIDDRTGSALTSYADLKLGLDFIVGPRARNNRPVPASRKKSYLRTEINASYWLQHSTDLDDVRARFQSDDEWFTLAGVESDDGVANVGLGLIYDWGYGELRIDGNYSMADSYTGYSGGLRAHFSF